MIKTNALHKYYNKNRSNALHVLNDISVDFPSKGLVVLLGASGSGKTTLLNVLSGMDKVHKGSIEFKDQIIKRYDNKTWDNLRNTQIGMIFQNYYLLPDQSVYENISLTLRMIGIDDKEMLDKRIDYVLDAVNMINYKKRLASQLSGGQQQRVAIARALAKNPQVILADEPTGNLDSKNTLDIMRIIKQISLDKLVILVTHERHLADHFADRIIELEDGKVIEDRLNTEKSALKHQTETTIYLNDMPTKKPFESEQLKIDYYGDEVMHEDFKIRLVMKNKTLYLDVRNQPVQKVVIVDQKSEINLLEQSLEDVSDFEENEQLFDRKELEISIDKKRHRLSIHPGLIVKQTLSKILDASRGMKLLYLGFAIGAMIIANSVSSIFNIIVVEDESILTMPKQTLVVTDDDYTYEQLINLRTHASIDYVRLHHNANIPIAFPEYFSLTSYNEPPSFLSANFVIDSMITAKDLSHGTMPTDPFEIVIDQAYIRKEIFTNADFRAFDIDTYEEIMFLTFNYYLTLEVMIPVKVVGISNTKLPVIYADEDLIMALFILNNHSINGYSTELFSDYVDLKSGTMPSSEKEVLLPQNLSTSYIIGSDYVLTIKGKTLTYEVVGFYDLILDEVNLQVTVPMYLPSDLDEQYFYTTKAEEVFGFKQETNRYLYVSNVELALEHLESLEIEGTYVYQTARTDALGAALYEFRPNLISSAVALLATALGFYFIIRSSMISRIYEIGVYRSLGVRKRDLVKRYMIESFILTTCSSLIGFGFMTYIIFTTQRAVGTMFRVGHVSFLSVVTGIIVLYTINVVSGIIPISSLLRKTPAQINTKYDL